MTYKLKTDYYKSRIYHINNGVIFDINAYDDGGDEDVKATDVESQLPQFTVKESGQTSATTYYLDDLIHDGDHYTKESGFTPSKHSSSSSSSYIEMVEADVEASVASVLMRYGLPNEDDDKAMEDLRKQILRVVPEFLLESSGDKYEVKSIKKFDDGHANLLKLYKQQVIVSAQNAALEKLQRYSFIGKPSIVTADTDKVEITEVALDNHKD